MRICSVLGTGLRTATNPVIKIIVILRMSFDLANCYFSIPCEILKECPYLYQTYLKGVFAVKTLLQDKILHSSLLTSSSPKQKFWTLHYLPLWVTKMRFEGLTVKKTNKSILVNTKALSQGQQMSETDILFEMS